MGILCSGLTNGDLQTIITDLQPMKEDLKAMVRITVGCKPGTSRVGGNEYSCTHYKTA